MVYMQISQEYIASDESGFNAFSILKCNLPKTKWFLKVIEKWFWFDDEDDIDWNDEGADCIHSSSFMSTMWTTYSCQIKSLLSYFIFNHLFLIMLDVTYRIFLFDDLFLLLIVLLKEGKLGI